MKLTWITIVTTKFEESKEFYRDFLGMEPGAAFSPNEFMDIAFFKDQNGMQVELIWSKKKTETISTSGLSSTITANSTKKQKREESSSPSLLRRVLQTCASSSKILTV